MQFKWDSGAALEIAAELDRLKANSSEVDRRLGEMEEILLQMAGGEADETLEAILSARRALSRRISALSEAIAGTARGIRQSNALFEEAEADLARGARDVCLAGGGPVGAKVGTPTGPQANRTPWPALDEITQTAAVDRLSALGSMMMPEWFMKILG